MLIYNTLLILVIFIMRKGINIFRIKLMRRFYHEKVVEYFENPPNVGSLDKTDPKVGTSTVGSVACGDLLKMQVKLGKDGKI